MLKERLKQAQQSFDEAEVKDGPDRIPDGLYRAIITNTNINDDKAGVLRWNIEVTVVHEDYAGRKGFPSAPLEGQYNGMSKKYLKLLGFDIDNYDLSNLPDDLNKIMGLEVEVNFVTKKTATGNDFQFCYINKKIESEANGLFAA